MRGRADAPGGAGTPWPRLSARHPEHSLGRRAPRGTHDQSGGSAGRSPSRQPSGSSAQPPGVPGGGLSRLRRQRPLRGVLVEGGGGAGSPGKRELLRDPAPGPRCRGKAASFLPAWAWGRAPSGGRAWGRAARPRFPCRAHQSLRSAATDSLLPRARGHSV
ncbi:hypothetical protein HJG60_007724 [Phyllostomus discolor]|uniref:Uncharacterized protein n=1 Tax=Phyllostomus discolor TaxID=89673 RepID=A0A834EVE4_9CHIR|nr:hypothetical protein HJG60_007724 [Phyllostomus discolor]